MAQPWSDGSSFNVIESIQEVQIKRKSALVKDKGGMAEMRRRSSESGVMGGSILDSRSTISTRATDDP